VERKAVFLNVESCGRCYLCALKGEVADSVVYLSVVYVVMLSVTLIIS